MARVKAELTKTWPKNRLIRLVFHGHSIPAGYFDTPTVRRYDSYPTLFHQSICAKYPTATIDLSVTAIGGEHSQRGAARFERDVLALSPDVVFIDYCMNDRALGLKPAREAWAAMIEACLQREIPVVLLTSSPTSQEDILKVDVPLDQHAKQVRELATHYQVPIVDSYREFKNLVQAGGSVKDYLSHPVHLNRRGHQVVADLLLDRFEQRD